MIFLAHDFEEIHVEFKLLVLLRDQIIDYMSLPYTIHPYGKAVTRNRLE